MISSLIPCYNPILHPTRKVAVFIVFSIIPIGIIFPDPLLRPSKVVRFVT